MHHLFIVYSRLTTFLFLSYSQLPSEAALLNCFGMTIVLYCGLIVYIVTKEEYKRPADQ